MFYRCFGAVVLGLFIGFGVNSSKYVNATQDNIPQPMPSPEEARFKDTEKKAVGQSYTVKRNRVYDAIAKAEHERVTLNKQLGLRAEKSDETFEQAAKSFLGCRPPKDLQKRIDDSHKRNPNALRAGPVTPLPASFDCRTQGWVNPIKNQAQCGSCWDFSGTGAVESANIKAGNGKSGQFILSEQFTLSCYSNGGCDGDWPETVLSHAKSSGLPFTSDYGPYQGQVTRCKSVSSMPGKIANYGYVGSSQGVADTTAIKTAMMQYGPIACAVAVDDAWSAYSSGVFTGTGYTGINHAIILVGWSDDVSIRSGGYWILRNSWDTSWGEQGYMRTAYGANSVGYGAMWCQATGNGPTPPDPTTFSVTLPPTMVATASTSVTFNATITNGTSPFVNNWVYGDGQTGTDPSHTYATNGSYTATVVVIDSKGETAKASTIVTVGVAPPPPPVVVYPTYSVTVTGQIPSGGIFGGSKTVTLTGTATPNTAAPKLFSEKDKEQRLEDLKLARAVKDSMSKESAEKGDKTQFSFGLVMDLLNLFSEVRKDGNGTLLADLAALKDAVANRTGVLAAAEKLLTDAVAIGSNPDLIAAVMKVLADLGM